MKVTTSQGVNFKWHNIKIPLYLKVLDFYSRHYNYKYLVARTLGDIKDEQEKIMAIFKWTHENIRKQPKDLPVIDDHVWNIIIRGYGMSDQSADVFTTLCSYAGKDAFYGFLSAKDSGSKAAFSFVKFGNKWHVLDSYNGVYFKNRMGEIASIEDLKSNDWEIVNIDGPDKPDLDYVKYFVDFPSIKEAGLNKANIQSPLLRSLYEIKKLLNRNIIIK